MFTLSKCVKNTYNNDDFIFYKRMNIEQLVTKQNNINNRLEDIERKYAQTWSNITRLIFTTIVSVVAGGLAVVVV